MSDKDLGKVFEGFQDFPERIAEELAGSYIAEQEKKKPRKKEPPVVAETGEEEKLPAFEFPGNRETLETISRENLTKFKKWLLQAYQIDEETLRKGVGEHFYALISAHIDRYMKLLEADAPIDGDPEIKKAIVQNNVPYLKKWLLENYQIDEKQLEEALADAYIHLGFDEAPELEEAESKTPPLVEADIASPEAPIKAAFDREAYRQGGVWYYRPIGEKGYLRADKNTTRTLEEEVRRVGSLEAARLAEAVPPEVQPPPPEPERPPPSASLEEREAPPAEEGFRFPNFLVQQNSEACRLFTERLKGLTPEEAQSQAWNIADEYKALKNLRESPYEIVRYVTGYGDFPGQYRQIIKRLEDDGITLPLTPESFPQAKTFLEYLRTAFDSEVRVAFSKIFWEPIAKAIKEYEEKERERKWIAEQRDRTDYPEPVRQLVGLMNSCYEQNNRASAISDETQRPQELQRIRDEMEKRVLSPDSRLDFYQHHDLTKVFADITRFLYPVRKGDKTDRFDIGNSQYVGYADGENGLLWLAPRDYGSYFTMHKAPDLLHDRFFVVINKETGEPLTNEEFNRHSPYFRFTRLIKPVALSLETLEGKDGRMLREKGIIEVEPIKSSK